MAEKGEPLSDRELEVLLAVVNGAANKQVAQTLHISQNTVKVHLRNIFTKLDVSSRTEAVTVALQQGLVVLPGTELADPGLNETADSTNPTIDTTPQAMETAVPKSKFSLNRTEIALILVTLVAVLLIGLFGWQVLTEPAVPTPEPFTEERIGESRWLRARPMNEGKAGMAVAAVGLEIYELGGETAAGVVNSVAIYDTTDHVWREATAKPTAVADVTAAILFGEVYVPGGRLGNGTVTAVVEAYSPANDAWRPIAALPQPLAGGLTLTDGSFLYFFGGWDGDAYVDTAYVYDPGADSWRPLEPMAKPRAFAAGEFVTGQLYVVGGYNGAELALCQSYDPVAAEWNDCPDMLQPRAGGAAASLINKLYVIGGGLEAAQEVTFSEVYDPVGKTWQVVNTPMLAERPSWTNLGVANVESRIFALGGNRGQAFSADTLVYAPFVYQTFIPAAAAGSNPP